MNSTTSIVGPGIPADLETRSIENPNTPITWSQLALLMDGGPAGSGKSVTPRSALKVSTVLACVRVIAFAIARMPLITYERSATGRERAETHPLYWPLRLRPHPDMSSFAARVALVSNILLWGRGYGEIIRRGDGQALGWVPIESYRVQPLMVAGERRYEVRMPDGGREVLLQRDVLDVPYLTLDGTCGVSVVANMRQTIGAQMAADEFSGKILANGLRPGGVLSHPKTLKDEGMRLLRESFQQAYGGPENAGKPLILEEGMTWAAGMMPLEDAQFIESSYFRVEEICRAFGVPPHKVGHLLRATNNNIEAQGLDFLGDTLAPLLVAVEQEMNFKFFPEPDRARYYVEHLTQVIVQMDAVTRAKLYETMCRIGAMNPDEVRERENLNKIPDRRGEVFTMPSIQMPLPTPEEAAQILASWIAKGGATKQPGAPAPGADGKLAGDNGAS